MVHVKFIFCMFIQSQHQWFTTLHKTNLLFKTKSSVRLQNKALYFFQNCKIYLKGNFPDIEGHFMALSPI